jgi:uncharacterized protein YcaQ
MTQLTLTPDEARRLSVAAQRLEAPPVAPSRAMMLDTIRQITCVQLDPINAVARSPLLVLYSRLGPGYNTADLEGLLWEDRALFEYWAHAASIVLADDFPLFQRRMQRQDRSNSAVSRRYWQWYAGNAAFRQYILDEMRTRGPLFANELEDRAEVTWDSSGWSSNRSVTMMIERLWLDGEVTVTRRDGDGFGLKKQWGLMEHQLPAWTDHVPWTEERVVRQAVERALPALGAGRLRDIRNYFTRGEYPALAKALAGLRADGRILEAAVGDWPGPWYLHVDTLPLLERLRGGGWRPQTVLLSPFDNLIADRDRTELLFDFFYRIEIYVPAAKRQYGYYVMPILHGDRLIGRVDSKMDRAANVLIVNAIHMEPGHALTGDTGAAVEAAIGDLAQFLGADTADIR